MFVSAGRYVTSAKSSGAGYRNRIRIGPNDRLHVRVDVTDKTAVTYVRACGADTNNIVGRRNAETGILAQGRVVAADAVN